MLYFSRIDISEGTDVSKTSASKECHICHYWYFSNKIFKFQPNVCKRCHDLLMIFMNLSDIAILNIKGFQYHCIISGISYNGAINLMRNINYTEKGRGLLIIKIKDHIKKWVKMFGDIKVEKIKFYHYKSNISQKMKILRKK